MHIECVQMCERLGEEVNLDMRCKNINFLWPLDQVQWDFHEIIEFLDLLSYFKL